MDRTSVLAYIFQYFQSKINVCIGWACITTWHSDLNRTKQVHFIGCFCAIYGTFTTIYYNTTDTRNPAIFVTLFRQIKSPIIAFISQNHFNPLRRWIKFLQMISSCGDAVRVAMEGFRIKTITGLSEKQMSAVKLGSHNTGQPRSDWTDSADDITGI